MLSVISESQLLLNRRNQIKKTKKPQKTPFSPIHMNHKIGVRTTGSISQSVLLVPVDEKGEGYRISCRSHS